jgi:hypothetical protein
VAGGGHSPPRASRPPSTIAPPIEHAYTHVEHRCGTVEVEWVPTATTALDEIGASPVIGCPRLLIGQNFIRSPDLNKATFRLLPIGGIFIGVPSEREVAVCARRISHILSLLSSGLGLSAIAHTLDESQPLWRLCSRRAHHSERADQHVLEQAGTACWGVWLDKGVHRRLPIRLSKSECHSVSADSRSYYVTSVPPAA